MRHLILTIALCVLLIAVSFFACQEYNKRLVAECNKVTTPPATTQKVSTYKDSSGRTQVIIKYKPPVPSATDVMKNLVPFVDSVAQALDIKPKQVDNILILQTEVQAKQIQFLQKKVDSLNRLNYYYKDKYLDLAIRTGLDS